VRVSFLQAWRCPCLDIGGAKVSKVLTLNTFSNLSICIWYVSQMYSICISYYIICIYIYELVWIGWRWLEETTFASWILTALPTSQDTPFALSGLQVNEARASAEDYKTLINTMSRYDSLWFTETNHQITNPKLCKRSERIQWILMVLVILIQLAAHWGFPHWQRAHCLRGLGHLRRCNTLSALFSDAETSPLWGGNNESSWGYQ